MTRVVTTHIGEMLAQALTLAKAAQATPEPAVELEAAAVLARHAAAELDDERMRLVHGVGVYEPTETPAGG